MSNPNLTLIMIVTSSHSNNNQIQGHVNILFNNSPIQIKCPFCLQNIRTEVILKPEFISILLGFALFVILPSFFTLVLTIIVLQITSTRKHRCPLCERQLGSDGKFLVFFDDDIYSFAFGTNGIIVSKKIIVSIVMGIVIFAVLSIRVNNAYADVNFTEMSWAQFEKQCPYDGKQQKCIYQNQGLTVKNWRGFVMRVQDNRKTIKRHFQHAVSLYVKMNDPFTLEINREQPDLFLTVTSYQAHIWQHQLNQLSHGDEIMFNGTFEALRNIRNMPIGRHLNIVEFNLTNVHNPDIHVYMSHEEDLWFFQKLGGEKLRKHQNQNDQRLSDQQKQIEKQVQQQLNKPQDNSIEQNKQEQKQQQFIKIVDETKSQPSV